MKRKVYMKCVLDRMNSMTNAPWHEGAWYMQGPVKKGGEVLERRQQGANDT